MIIYHVNEFKNSIAAVLKAEEFNNKTFVGVAHCSNKDTFNEKVGCEIARIRAIKKLEQYKTALLKRNLQKMQECVNDTKAEILHKEARMAELDIDLMNVLATLED